jgi:hypothetical protein
MYLDDKYTKIYYSLISNAKSRNFKTRKEAVITLNYVERHHIIPISLGGDNSNLNLVYLTAREHFVAHWLLSKMCDGKNHTKMVNAFWAMKRKGENQYRYSTKITSRAFEKLKIIRKEILSKNMSGEGNPMFGKTGSLAPCHGRTGEKHPLFGTKTSPESNKKRSDKLSGVPKSKESNKKRSDSHRGKKHDYQKGEKNQCFIQLKNGNHPSQIKKTCPHCEKTVSINSFAKYHGANCHMIKERTPLVKQECPHCNTLAAPSQYSRYHGDKCKHNKISVVQVDELSN